jgi:hypothetical protein
LLEGRWRCEAAGSGADRFLVELLGRARLQHRVGIFLGLDARAFDREVCQKLFASKDVLAVLTAGWKFSALPSEQDKSVFAVTGTVAASARRASAPVSAATARRHVRFIVVPFND